MSNDMIPEKVGMGQLLYKDGTPVDGSVEAAQEYLTYSKTHRYVLSSSFTEEMPELLSEQYVQTSADEQQKGGRDYIGQAYTTIENKDYILIGNEQQLRAVGSDKSVTPMLFLRTEAKFLGVPLGHKIIPYYPGDADFNVESILETGISYQDIKEGTEDFQYKKQADEAKKKELMNIDWGSDTLLGEIVGIVGGLLGGILGSLFGEQELVGLKVDANHTPSIGAEDGGLFGKAEFTPFGKLKDEYVDKKLKYSSNANYIIFRDIDLSQGEYSNGEDDDWKPLQLAGNMEGWRNMESGAPVTISNVHVKQTAPLDLQKDSGIGFFGSISSHTIFEKGEGGGGFKSSGRIKVQNIHLDHVQITNSASTVDKTPDSLIEGILGALGGLLGGLLDTLLQIIPGLSLGDTIKNLLELKKSSPDLFATGSFAGRIVGDVTVENCKVTNTSVQSVKGMSGGFVGYTEGAAKYDGLSKILGAVVDILSGLLNIIPGVGLGDLITILLENDIALDKLIPTGYYNPIIKNCSVVLSDGQIGNQEQDYNGGFVGAQTATEIRNCSVENLKIVQAKNGAGGFAGIERDVILQGALNDLGIQLAKFNIDSKQNECRVDGSDIQVIAANYAGGFNGVMANSSSRSSSVNHLKQVSAENYAGGFTGRATIGYGTVLGDDGEKNHTLLKSITILLEKLVTSGETGVELNPTLLSLAGLTPSELYDCTIAGEGWSVSATGNYAGGFIGQGDGVKLSANGNGNHLTNLTSVTAENYAGGIAGSIVTANPIGVLNKTLGVGSYLASTAENITVTGQNLAIEAKKKYASGGFGLVLGGRIDHVDIRELASVTAGNYAGGLAGRSGTGALAKEGGLDVLGLGLVKVDNLLSLAEGVQVEIANTTVSGIASGMVIRASGKVEMTDGESILAGGFISEAEGVQVNDSNVRNLKQVSAEHTEGKESFAGGFIGRSHTGGLAGVAREEEDGSLKLPGIANVDSLLTLVPYLLPKYSNAVVTFVTNEKNPQVQGTYAGGFVGAMQSGLVETTGIEPYVVFGLEMIQGEDYAGGFSGKVDAGAVASSDGLELLGGILNLSLDNLIDVLNVYIPSIQSAGVKSAEQGFTVEATEKESAAGGYIGYGSGVQIKQSDVTSLAHTVVAPPTDSLESTDGSSYFGENSQYAVKGGKYAGGYIGCVDIDSAAAVGGGLGLLGDLLNLENVLSALDAVASKISDSDVEGCSGGFSVLANGTDKAGAIGKAGGFAGRVSGSQIQKCNVRNFAYIIGQEMSGGFAGEIEPGNVAAILEDGSILDGIVNIRDSVASLVNTFIPIIEDSSTSAVPCGGAVRAEGLSEAQAARGIAGGYVGYNHGGRIDGKNMECAVHRLRSVYGGEFAGGFTGLLENADLAGTGNISLLFGLVELGNVLSLLNAVYPTETNTAVYGPLRNVDMNTWNAWVKGVGEEGVYGKDFPTESVQSEEELQNLIREYAYGYRVKAGREHTGTGKMQAGIAGGYVGRMEGGVITEAHAWDAKDILAYRSAGGFAGEMVTGGVAEIGSVSLLKLDILGSLNAVQTFVPVIRNSDITGYQSGMQVKTTGIPKKNASEKIEKCGYAGGFVGSMIGGQIWGNWSGKEKIQTDAKPDPSNNRCFVANLRRVDGSNAVGGFAGKIEPGSAAALNTSSSEGLMGGLLQKLIGTPGDLLSLLNATLSTVTASDVKAWDDWGILVNGVYSDGSANTKYAKAAGGFAGEIRGAVIGDKDVKEQGVHVENLRSVTGGEHAGGFFGLADVSAVAEITGDGKTSILQGLLTLGSSDVLDAFRTYIYDSSVAGTKEAGLEVLARDGKKQEYVNDSIYTGNAGGFGGTLLNSSVKRSAVTNLRIVEGQNYTGGFIGHLGKSGVVDLDSLGVFKDVIGVGAGVMDVFGSHVENSRVEGMEDGFTVKSENTINAREKEEIAGGFTGYADLAKLDRNEVMKLKQVASEEIAGGFAGKTSFAYLAKIQADSWLVNQLVGLLNKLLKALWVENLQEGKVIHINLGIITVDALYKGDLVHVDLLGLPIRIRLAKGEQLATIYIGDSKIELNCSDDGTIQNNAEDLKNELNISLIKANRTRIANCKISGIPVGYDVYGGGAGNQSNGSGEKGCAGGFVGFNNEGLLKENSMEFADVIRGTKGMTGPFTGKSALKSEWEFNKLEKIEGENNTYHIYRELHPEYENILGKNGQILQNQFETSQNPPWNIYTIKHLGKGKVETFEDLKGAVLSDGTNTKPLQAYEEEGAMAVLMNNTPTKPTPPGGGEEAPDIQDPCKDTIELRVKKIWKEDEEETRPKEIVLHVTRTYEVDGETIEDTEFNGKNQIVLTESDYQSKDTWEKVFGKFAAYKEGENGQKYYYTYHVSEDVLSGYHTEISYKGKYQYGVTITNSKEWEANPLPETGGMGTTPYYAIGILLLALLGMTEVLRRKKRKAESL